MGQNGTQEGQGPIEGAYSDPKPVHTFDFGGAVLGSPGLVTKGRFRGEGGVGSEKFWSEARDG